MGNNPRWRLPCSKTILRLLEINEHILIGVKNTRKECMTFSIIIHYPESSEGKKELAKRVADVHVQTVLEIIKAMPLTVEQKVHLISAIKDYIPK